MKIKLELMLEKNKTSLREFINKNKLTSFKEFIEYCEKRKFVPVSEEQFNLVNKSSNVKEDKAKKPTRKTSKSQKTKSNRTSRKSKSSSSRVSKSTDKRED